jgi:Adenine/guanine phosphoribosyltransferases and related PRPP-binding proteins
MSIQMTPRERLEARLTRDGSLLGNYLVGATTFINHRVAIDLVDDCAATLASSLRPFRPGVVLTAEVSGIAPAALVARHLQIDMIYARKALPLTASGAAHATQAHSQTFRADISLHLREGVLSAGTRVVIVDDFLSTGSTMTALLHLCRLAEASVSAAGVLVNKEFLGGRHALAALGVPLYSITTITAWSDAGLVFAPAEG